MEEKMTFNHTQETPVMEAEYDVFISYSRKDFVNDKNEPVPDSPVARLLGVLDENKVRYWIDRDGIYAGAKFSELIVTAIRQSKMMIFVSSASSNDSVFTAGEIFEAHDSGIPIIPFRIDDAMYSDKFRLLVSPLDRIDYFVNPEVAFKRLLDAIKTNKQKYDEKIALAREAASKLEQIARREQLLIQAAQKEEDHKSYVRLLNKLENEIAGLHVEAGEQQKLCPVCGGDVPYGDLHCGHCGWSFFPDFGGKNTAHDSPQYIRMLTLWNKEPHPKPDRL